MKKLSEFKGNAGIDVVADLLPYIEEIVRNPENREAKGKSKIAFVSSILKNNKPAIKGIFAVLNETPVDEFEISAATIFVDTLSLLNDEALIALFGLQSKSPNQASSGSVSVTTEAPEQ